MAWADLAPNLPVVGWLDREGSTPGRAFDVGCGLGHTAEDLALRGFEVVAFDAAPTAAEPARQLR